MKLGFGNITGSAFNHLAKTDQRVTPFYNDAARRVTSYDVDFDHTLKILKIALEGDEKVKYGDTRQEVRYLYCAQDQVYYRDADNVLRLVEDDYKQQWLDRFQNVPLALEAQPI